MINIIKQEIEIKETLKQIIIIICDICNTILTIINGSIRKIDRDDREIYYDVSNDLYTHGVINDNDMNEIYDYYKYFKDRESKNINDDFEL